jgi:glycosyltransferase involved in cell wall biosynthesis
MGQAAVAWQRALRLAGFVGDVFADDVASEFHHLVRPMSQFQARPEDLVLYHHGIASPLAGRLLHEAARRGVVFHNITPPTAYRGTRLEEPLVAGRAQLAALAEGVELSIGVSQWNANELREAGHRNVHVVPLYVEPERFTPGAADVAMKERLRGLGSLRLVSVSRVVPHKRVEDLVALHAEVRRLVPDAHLTVVGGYQPGHAAWKALAAKAEEVGGVTFLGRVSHAELVAAYRSAHVYVSMSEHEGVGVPLLEAMAAELPVLAFGAAAVPETMGGAGVVFDEKHHAALAQVVQLLTTDFELRARVVAGQLQRVAAYSLSATSRALGTVLGAPSVHVRHAPRRPRVTFVVQRYGPHLTGGAEAHARMVAERLTLHAQVEVLTTCAVDHLTWANELPEGVEHDGEVTVHRFATSRARQMREFNQRSKQVFGRMNDLVAEEAWVADQGPLAPGLMDALVERRDRDDAFIFFTSLYAPTAHGLPLVKGKALLVPTLHDEPPMQFRTYDDCFTSARAILCNTPEERDFLRARFPFAARTEVVGVGVEAPHTSGQLFREHFRLEGPYVLYLGRIEEGKGVGHLLQVHERLTRHFHDAPKLVLAGAGSMEVRGTHAVKVGRLDEGLKWSALAGAMAVVVPSEFESLSLVTLEAFAVGTPVLGNARSAVVSGQLERSLAGATWTPGDLESYVAAVQVVGEGREALSGRARAYAARSSWGNVVDTYLREIARLGAGT